MNIKAIDTKYKNRLFRSRLEARWAVFFDVLGIEWDYEPEGYQLPSGKYLPDFFLSEVHYDVFVEVKAGQFTQEEITKCDELSAMTGKDVAMVSGMPAAIGYPAKMRQGDGDNNLEILFWRATGHRDNSGKWVWPSNSEVESIAADPIYQDAVLKAASARFEHGETGIPNRLK